MLGRSGTFYRAGYLCRRANDWPNDTDGQTEDTQDDNARAQTAIASPSTPQDSPASPVLFSENIPPAGPNNNAQNFPKPSGQAKQGLGGSTVRPMIGTPQMPKVAPLTGQQLRQRMDATQPLLNSCRVPFSREIPGFSMGTFLNRMHNATYTQYPDPATNPMGLSSVEANTDNTGPMSRRVTRLYPDYFTDTPERQGAILDHENIHRYTGWDDPHVFRTFAHDGLVRKDPYGTDEITQWILRGCKPKE
jgi:hypothetical protein